LCDTLEVRRYRRRVRRLLNSMRRAWLCYRSRRGRAEVLQPYAARDARTRMYATTVCGASAPEVNSLPSHPSTPALNADDRRQVDEILPVILSVLLHARR